MDFLFLIAGICIGFALAWLLKKAKPSVVNAEETNQLRNQLMDAIKESNLFKGKNESLQNENLRATDITNQQQIQINELTSLLAAARQNNENLESKLSAQKEEMNQLQQQFTKEFENLANRIFEEKSKKFTDQNKTNLDDILKPFQERIKDFEKKVDTTYEKEMREKISLSEEVKKLYELNTKISEEANNLTRALKGDTKKQGNWGELILEKVLERSGLEKDREYQTQVVTKNVDGDIIKPDVVVFLPDNKHLIIDSKVSLTAYEQYASADETSLRDKFLKEHVLSVRSHVKLLGEKGYYTSGEFATPDFVLLFMPMESAFSAAVQFDQDLFQFAWDKRIVIVSPTTLLATLKTVESLWKMEKQNKNTMEIVRQAGALYDKFEGFVKDLLDIGKKMDDSKRSYEEAMKKISSGSGNLIKRVENLKTLGAKAEKALPSGLLDRANED